MRPHYLVLLFAGLLCQSSDQLLPGISIVRNDFSVARMLVVPLQGDTEAGAQPTHVPVSDVRPGAPKVVAFWIMTTGIFLCAVAAIFLIFQWRTSSGWHKAAFGLAAAATVCLLLGWFLMFQLWRAQPHLHSSSESQELHVPITD